VAAVTALLAEWNTIATQAETSAGNVTTTQESKRLARENLQLMPFLTLLKLAEMYARQPGQLSLYMQQSLLEDPASPDEDEEEPPPPAP
jgi:hypothetical protein